jgi:hypothetical protein
VPSSVRARRFMEGILASSCHCALQTEERGAASPVVVRFRKRDPALR